MSDRANRLEESKEAAVRAIGFLITSPHLATIEDYLRERREDYISDAHTAICFRDHPDLVHTMARVAECDDLLKLFADCRKRISAEPAKQ